MWGLNLVYMLAKKISSHFDIGEEYMLHRGTCALVGAGPTGYPARKGEDLV